MFLFYAFALLSIAGAFGVLCLRSPVHGAMSLVGTFFSLGTIYVMMQAEFVAVVQVLVYAGAIMVLFLFVLMLLSIPKEDKTFINWTGGKIIGAAMAFGIWTQLALALGRFAPERLVPPELAEQAPDTIKQIGQLLFSEYLLPFEAISLLLLVAVLGAVVIAKRRYPGAPS
jgi:NADH-quinone oxidoreductase subunit J